MTCRCSSPQEHAERERRHKAGLSTQRLDIYKDKVKELEETIAAMTVKPQQFEILHLWRAGPHLVLKVKYPSCTECESDGVKVMVFLHVEEMAAMRWRRIDPHFRDRLATEDPAVAPSPDARFPNTEAGWQDAMEYAESKNVRA